MRSISKHIPQRTCVACRKVKPKQQLIRLVCDLEGGVEVDVGGKMAGRGAYLCRARECWESGLRGGHLEHALRSTIAPENREQLIRYRLGKELVSGR